ncbi:MAG TPA: hypothetical protein VG675_20730 [Bryobacteraceae bacterium]|nr:hypothetical protein [Bryobacteraceae bacterium]
MHIWKWLRIPPGIPRIPALILLLLLAGQAPLARAQEKTVGGHLGFGFPLVTTAGGDVTTLADSFQMSLPVAITVSGSGRMYFDLEFVPLIVDSPREVRLTVNPGILWRLGHGFAVGSRVGFDVNSSQFGITPLVVKSWPIEHSFFRAYFIETDYVVRFNRPIVGRATNPFTFNMVFGLAF